VKVTVQRRAKDVPPVESVGRDVAQAHAGLDPEIPEPVRHTGRSLSPYAVPGARAARHQPHL
jgi:hypothetical protein